MTEELHDESYYEDDDFYIQNLMEDKVTPKGKRMGSSFTPPSIEKKPKYPWDEWFDGGWWRITKGQDFTLDNHGMRNVIRQTARKYHGRVTIRQDPEDKENSFYFQFISDEEQEEPQKPQKPEL